jgi:hypothetical protein
MENMLEEEELDKWSGRRWPAGAVSVASVPARIATGTSSEADDTAVETKLACCDMLFFGLKLVPTWLAPL